VIPIAAPTDEERAQPYLWRFWRHLPAGAAGHDLRPQLVRPRARRARRGVLREADWMRAYGEINDFEEQLSENGVVVVKFWLADHAGRAAAALQGARDTPFKRFKITAEDWRNREKWRPTSAP
jgi:AMP-polyphosphate phosphotransferase